MGIYINPGNIGFDEVNDEDYVDKTMLINIINESIGTDKCLFCISRPRRFGKTYAAKMLTAYYDCSCDSHFLFDDKKIAKCVSYEKHLNQYNVISFDITGFISHAIVYGKPLTDVTKDIEESIIRDLCRIYPELSEEKDLELCKCLYYCVNKTGRQFVFIIDEYDALIREAPDDSDAQELYFHLLRRLFKNGNFTPDVVAAAYLTGILPLKEFNTFGAVSDFDGYPITEPCEFAEFTGFLEDEVIAKCNESDIDYQEMKEWYFGYDLSGVGTIYNPYSVMNALNRSKCECYWNRTSAPDSIFRFINLEFEGLQEKLMRIIIGENIRVDINDFQNDFITFNSADDVLTLLIHLGYLTYCEKTETVRIPNNELREHFEYLISCNDGENWRRLVDRSKKLLDAAVNEDVFTFQTIMDEILCEQYSPNLNSNPQSLLMIIKYAFIYAEGKFSKIEELSEDMNVADLAYIPDNNTQYPAILVEFKMNDSSDGLIDQIRARTYPAALNPFAGYIVLVEINHDEKTGKHTCTIEKA